MLELWQTEWCPASRRVRERLTELDVDYLVHQVPVEKDHRVALREATGVDTIPVLTLEHGGIVLGEPAIMGWLDEHVAETPETDAHKTKAAMARRRYLEEECGCSPPATP